MYDFLFYFSQFSADIFDNDYFNDNDSTRENYAFGTCN